MRKKKNNIQLSCIVGTVYSLLLSLLIIEEKVYKQTYFFIDGAGISKTIADRLDMHYYVDVKRELSDTFVLRSIKRIIRYRLRNLFWPFLKDKPIIGQDHLYISPSIIGENTICIVEDGMANYSKPDELLKENKLKVKNKFLNDILFGPLCSQLKYGYSNYAQKIFLTNKSEIPPLIKDKVITVSPIDLWEQKSIEYKNEILKIFDCSIKDYDYLKQFDIIILTQPYSPVYMTDDELIDIYRKIIDLNYGKKILIKTHPREIINYKDYFSVEVYDKQIPMELFSILNLNFEKAYTITSTAIFSMPEKTTKIILGPECNPNLNEKLGKICDFKKVVQNAKIRNYIYGKVF